MQAMSMQQLRTLGASSKSTSRQRCAARRPARVVRVNAEADPIAKAKAMQEAAARMQDMMKNPAAQAEMQQMMSVMQNPAFMERIKQLREDPELKPMFEEMKKGGMMAMMKYMNDPTFLAKIGEKMGDIPAEVAGGAAPAAAEPEEVEVNNILDAVKYNDIEAVEDYIAIGKGGLTDPEGRSALHYAAAYSRDQCVKVLLENKADLTARDIKGNVPLHYAAGYGKGEIVRMLIAAGADVSATNDNGQTAAVIIRGEPRNPLNQDAELLAMLEGK